MGVREVKFVCCFCGEEVAENDEEARQLALLENPGEENEQAQWWWCHRKPCFEAAIHPMARVFDY